MERGDTGVYAVTQDKPGKLACWLDPARPPAPPIPGLTSGTRAGGNALWTSLAVPQHVLNKDMGGHPTPTCLGPLGFQETFGRKRKAAVPTELLGAGQRKAILICLGFLFSCLAAGLGKELLIGSRPPPPPGRDLPEDHRPPYSREPAHWPAQGGELSPVPANC